ncbi:MAG: hypothetical protein UHD09_06535 [Bifidobacterium sp.]|nr:hypothetical protein [Bifidobacterium sp.]
MAMMIVPLLLLVAAGCSGKGSPASDGGWSEGISTPKALRSYVQEGKQPMAGYRLGSFLGEGKIVGKGTIPIKGSEPLSKDTAYSVTFLCNADRDVPYRIGIRNGDGYHQMGHEEGCGGGIASLTMPASTVPDATEVVIDAEPDGQVIAVVFEVVQEEE